MCAKALAGGVTCASNSVNGVPACASAALLNSTLRNDFEFQGFVTAADGAVAAIGSPFHNYTNTAQEAAAAALSAGTDSDSSSAFSTSLGPALAAGLVSETTVDTAVKRLLLARLRLGQLDFAAGTSALGKAKTSDLSSTTHVALNERASFEGVVLLQNNATSEKSPTGEPARWLPLSGSSLSKVVMVGPHADARLNLLGSGHGAFPAGSVQSP